MSKQELDALEEEEVKFEVWDYIAIDFNTEKVISSGHTEDAARLLAIARGIRHPIVVHADDYLRNLEEYESRLILTLAGVK